MEQPFLKEMTFCFTNILKEEAFHKMENGENNGCFFYKLYSYIRQSCENGASELFLEVFLILILLWVQAEYREYTDFHIFLLGYIWKQ